MPERLPFARRGDTREQTRRDLDRLRRRDPSGGFWPSLALIGSVGWPIVLLATGGGFFGRYVDQRWGTGVRVTLILVVVGASLGTFAAFRAVRRDER